MIINRNIAAQLIMVRNLSRLQYTSPIEMQVYWYIRLLEFYSTFIRHLTETLGAIIQTNVRNKPIALPLIRYVLIENS